MPILEGLESLVLALRSKTALGRVSEAEVAKVLAAIEAEGYSLVKQVAPDHVPPAPVAPPVA